MGSQRRRLAGGACALTLAAALLGGVSVPARASTVHDDWKAVQAGLQRAVKSGALDAQTAATYRADAQNALAVMSRIPPGRAVDLGFVFHEVAAQAKLYDAPRSLALFSMLAENATYFAAHPLPTGRIDVADADGIVYRYFPGMGLQYHPLASFGALNAAVAAQDSEATETLADALVARGEPAPLGTLRFEYWFPFEGGKPGWVSGMTQSVAAQALARASQLVDPSLMNAARASYGLVSHWLIQQLPSGPWVKLYAFNKDVVLNAQLQTILSLDDYADLSGDTGAQALADRLQATAEALLPRFDSGFWSYYSLAKDESTLGYHQFVVQLLQKLATRTGDTTWSDMATKFSDDMTNPPEIDPGKPGPATIVPVPQDGFRDGVTARFWLSKISKVTLSLGSATRTITLAHGTHTLTLDPGRAVQPGTVTPQLTAVDLAGNESDTTLPDVTVVWDTAPPVVDASLDGTTLRWTGTDPGTPWLRLTVELRAGSSTARLQLGQRGLAGRRDLHAPSGTWGATLVATNSAGKTARIALGRLSG
jgi:hypothetical protein